MPRVHGRTGAAPAAQGRGPDAGSRALILTLTRSPGEGWVGASKLTD
jgi:hypothetical protein